MDELDRLQLLQPAVAASTRVRAEALERLRRAMSAPPRHRRRTLTVIASGVVAATLAASAYALYSTIIVGAPAPRGVKARESLFQRVTGSLIPTPGQPNPGIEIAKTKLAAEATTSVGPIYLWVAPDTRPHEYCDYTQIVANNLPGGRPNLSGGCGIDDGFRVGISIATVKGRQLGILHGHITTKSADTLHVQFADGTAGTYPITNDFVIAEVSPGAAIARFAVLDVRGRILASKQIASPISPIAQAKQQRRAFQARLSTSQMHTIASLRTRDTHQLLVLSGNSTRTCRRLTISNVRLPHGKAAGMAVSGCGSRPLAPTALNVGPGQFGAAPHGLLVLWGPVGSAIAKLEIRFGDGTHTAIPIHDGYVLFRVSPENYRSGHRPRELVARDVAGHVVRTRKFGYLR
jgi:hypothetical protein